MLAKRCVTARRVVSRVNEAQLGPFQSDMSMLHHDDLLQLRHVRVGEVFRWRWSPWRWYLARCEHELQKAALSELTSPAPAGWSARSSLSPPWCKDRREYMNEWHSNSKKQRWLTIGGFVMYRLCLTCVRSRFWSFSLWMACGGAGAGGWELEESAAVWALPEGKDC